MALSFKSFEISFTSANKFVNRPRADSFWKRFRSESLLWLIRSLDFAPLIKRKWQGPLGETIFEKFQMIPAAPVGEAIVARRPIARDQRSGFTIRSLQALDGLCGSCGSPRPTYSLDHHYPRSTPQDLLRFVNTRRLLAGVSCKGRPRSGEEVLNSLKERAESSRRQQTGEKQS